MTNATVLTDRFERALVYAAQVHGGQTRKGTGTPYLAHLLAVAATVLEYGGGEDTAIGALCWLPDLTAWADIVARCLKPGGTFYMLEVHPMSLVFESVPASAGGHELRPAYSYFPDPAGILDDGARPSYAGTANIKTPVYEWQHSLSEIINAIISAGLTVEFLNEFPVAPYPAFPQMRKRDGWWRLVDNDGAIPFLFSIKATK